MKARKNPYKKGGACYFAWEAGYIAALDDMKMMEEAMDSVEKTMAEMKGGQAEDGRDREQDTEKERREDGMIPWWVGLLLFVGGIAVGITEMAICAGSWDKKEEREKKKAR